MKFGIPEDNITPSPRSSMSKNPLRAEGSLDYREFIDLVKHLWEEIYPEIDILPVQGKTYANPPVIVYSLENRKTHNTEPKQRFREEMVAEGDDNFIISGQRFQNYIAFSAITDTDPKLCENIIETFEEFMLEHTPLFKKLGLSDIFYSRRLSDREETRTGDDVCIRTVVYMCVIERVTRTSVAKLQEILTNVSVGSKIKPLGNYAWVPQYSELADSDVPSNVDYINANVAYYFGDLKLKEGDYIKLHRPSVEDPFFESNWKNFALPSVVWGTNTVKLPAGLMVGEVYKVDTISEDNIFSLSYGGTPVDIRGYGWFKIIPLRKGKVTIDLDDITDLPSATP